MLWLLRHKLWCIYRGNPHLLQPMGYLNHDLHIQFACVDSAHGVMRRLGIHTSIYHASYKWGDRSVLWRYSVPTVYRHWHHLEVCLRNKCNIKQCCFIRGSITTSSQVFCRQQPPQVLVPSKWAFGSHWTKVVGLVNALACLQPFQLPFGLSFKRCCAAFAIFK